MMLQNRTHHAYEGQRANGATSVKSQPLFKTLFVSFHRFLFSDAFMVTYDYLFKHFYIF